MERRCRNNNEIKNNNLQKWENNNNGKYNP